MLIVLLSVAFTVYFQCYVLADESAGQTQHAVAFMC